MARITHSPDELGTEVQAPWGYYQPEEQGTLDYGGRPVLYTLGSACIEASCCGKGSWDYARVEGYVVTGAPGAGARGAPAKASGDSNPTELDTVENPKDRAAIAKLVEEKHPGVRVEFR